MQRVEDAGLEVSRLGAQRLVLEAVAVGSLLWDVERRINLHHHTDLWH
jgi:hypothetical protein